MKKIMSLILTLTLFISMLPGYASANNSDPMIKRVNNVLEEEIDADGNIIKSVSVIDNAVYLYEVTKDLVFSIGVYDNNLADVAVKEVSTGEIFADVLDIGDMAQYKNIDNNRNKIEKIKKDIIKGKLFLSKFDTDKYLTKNFVRTLSLSNEDKIMEQLYDNGWPEAYTDYLRDSKIQDGATAELRHSVSYSITERSSKMILAGTTLSVIVLYFTWPAQLWAQIASVVLTGNGVYEAVKDFSVTDYNVYAYGNKVVNVEGDYQYQAGRTVEWKAIVADLGATLDLLDDDYHYDYFDNDALLEKGLYNYFNL